MSSRIYRLLRNNKEEGPFTCEELIQKGFKPFDLIWADGRSAAWSYPEEMPEFKPFFKTESKTVTPKRISQTVMAAIAVNDNIADKYTAKEKPRFKVSAAWSKIQTVTAPAETSAKPVEARSAQTKMIHVAEHSLNGAHALTWEDAWQDWQNEKKPVSPVTEKPKTAFVPSVKKTAEAPVLEKKFEQSLDTITNNYINSILQQKKKTAGFNVRGLTEFILPCVALVIIFSIAYWLMHNKASEPVKNIAAPQVQAAQVQNTSIQNNSTGSENSAAENKPQQASVITQTKPVADDAVENNAVKNASFSTISSTKKNTIVPQNDLSKNTIAPVHNSVADVAKPVKQSDPQVINNTASSNNTGDLNAQESRAVRRRTDDNSAVNEPAGNVIKAKKNADEKTAASYVSVPEYISMSDGTGDIKIQNISEDNLDLVVVDVQYFDGSGRFLKGETMYLHNLKAGKSITIKTSRDINAAYATSKLSMISSDANSVYAVGDN